MIAKLLRATLVTLLPLAPAPAKRDPDNSHAATLLHYLLIEAAVGLPNSSWSLVGRVHHRLFSHSGSNVLAVGVRYRF